MPGEWLEVLSDRKAEDPARSFPLWGSLLDALRSDAGGYPDPAVPARLIAIPPRSVVDKVIKADDWNEVVVIAQGPRIRILLNGVQTVDYVEKGKVPLTGRICLQTHEGQPSEAWYREIAIRTLP